jgi:tetratricopeptide (TPR) repeat protein
MSNHKFKLKIILCVSIISAFFHSYTFSQSYYAHTQRTNTAIPVFRFFGSEDPTWIAYTDSVFLAERTGDDIQYVNMIDHSSIKYNCHGYAYAFSEFSYPYCSMDPGYVHLYWDDESYISTDNFSNPFIEIFDYYSYGALNHSARIRWIGNNDSLISKYGTGPLMAHPRTTNRWGSPLMAYVFYKIYIPGSTNSIETAIYYAVSGQEIHITGSATLSSNRTVAEGVNIYVDAGGTLSISSGVTLTFASNTSLIVNGTLNVYGVMNFSSSSSLTINGSIYANGATFQGNGSSWNGIIINSGTSGSITYCTIKDATNGIQFINNALQFQNNMVTNCSTGIIFNNTGSSGSLVRDNKIEYNTNGISFTGYSYPLIFPTNRIKENNYGAIISSTSAPDFGRYSDQGHNSIHDGYYYNIYSNYSGTIWAKYNWWGSYPPSPNVYGTIDYSEAINYDPNPLIKVDDPIATGIIIQKKMLKGDNKSTDEIPGLKELDEARGLFSQGKYSNALSAFETILNNYNDYLSGQISLFFIDECLNQLNRQSESVQKLGDIIRANVKKDISGVAQMIQRKYLIKEGKYNEAISNAINSKTDFPNSQFEKYSLYDMATIYWFYLGDKKSGEQYYRLLISLYPDDPLTDAALATLGEWKPQQKEIEKPASMTKVESLNILEQNYPNPFNPSTKITYNVPKDGKVKLSIYDVLGREISTLANENKTVGKYSVQFNSDRLSSGTYFYRVVIIPMNGEKEIIQQKAMQVVK